MTRTGGARSVPFWGAIDSRGRAFRWIAWTCGRAFTREQLLREVWGYLSLGRTRTLDSHASRLRRKLRQAGAGPCVVNVWGVGYRLLGE